MFGDIKYLRKIHSNTQGLGLQLCCWEFFYNNRNKYYIMLINISIYWHMHVHVHHARKTFKYTFNRHSIIWEVIDIVIVGSHACPHHGSCVLPLHGYSNSLLQVEKWLGQNMLTRKKNWKCQNTYSNMEIQKMDLKNWHANIRQIFL